MLIVDAIIRLRDDLKTWATNNFNFLNNKINNKADLVEGKGLSTNDFTNEDKNKLNSTTSIQLVSWEDSDF